VSSYATGDVSSLLLLLLDSRSPAGGHNHSAGLEAAVTAGYIRDVGDVEDFCRGRLRTSGRVAAGAAAAAALLAQADADPSRWRRLDAEVSARTPSPAARAASRQLGAGLRRLVRAMLPDRRVERFWTAITPAAPHHPLVLGAAVAAVASPDDAPVLAARAAALSACTAPASGAVRLLGLDPYAVHALLARLSPEIDTVADGAAHAARAGRAGELPAHSAPALDLLADIHATAEVRLFAS
jgi:urease accessory protein